MNNEENNTTPSSTENNNPVPTVDVETPPVEEQNQTEEQKQYEEASPQFQEVEPIPKAVRTDSYFDGGLLELIGWRLLAALITIVTLGIANPWAKCMLYNYQFKHTVYNGKRLKFEGTGGDLFVNYFKWVFLSIVTLGIYIFFIPVRKTSWVISHLHYEDEQLITNESYFDGKTIQLIGINILCFILAVISFGLLIPFTVCFRLRWINKHAVINRKKLVFNGRAINLFGKYLLWGFLTIITFGIFGLWVPIKKLKWQSKNIHIKEVGEAEEKDTSLYIAIPIAIIAVIIFALVVPFAINKISETNIDITNPFGGKTTRNHDYEETGYNIVIPESNSNTINNSNHQGY